LGAIAGSSTGVTPAVSTGFFSSSFFPPPHAATSAAHTIVLRIHMRG
jgi:hypothetical protein